MKAGDLLPTSAAPQAASAAAAAAAAKPNTTSIFGKGRYKFWALAGIILLAFWSMLTGTVTLNLKWSAGNLTSFSDDFDPDLHPYDLDVLEVEEREKVVRHMWDVYTSQSRRIRLPRFWQDAFEAAYEELASDVSALRDSAVSEIAKMSMRMVDLQPPAHNSNKNFAGKNKRNEIDITHAKAGTLSSIEVQ